MGEQFLLPCDNAPYKFPDFIIKNRELIKELLQVRKDIYSLMSEPFSKKMRLAEARAHALKNKRDEFKKITGVIGSPFDSRDVNLFLASNSVTIEMDYKLD